MSLGLGNPLDRRKQGGAGMWGNPGVLGLPATLELVAEPCPGSPPPH